MTVCMSSDGLRSEMVVGTGARGVLGTVRGSTKVGWDRAAGSRAWTGWSTGVGCRATGVQWGKTS